MKAKQAESTLLLRSSGSALELVVRKIGLGGWLQGKPCHCLAGHASAICVFLGHACMMWGPAMLDLCRSWV